MRTFLPLLLSLNLSFRAQAEAPKIFQLPQENQEFIQLKSPRGARFQLKLRGDEIALREGQIHCEPGTRVRRPYYISYSFEAEAFKAAFPHYAQRSEVMIKGIVEGIELREHEVPVGRIRLYQVRAVLRPEQSRGPIYEQLEILRADFDQALIRSIDELPPPYPQGSKYQIGAIPTKAGASRIYKLQAIIQGRVSYAEEPVSIHQLLMLKIDGAGLITEGYHYTLEWSDIPSLRLYAVTAQGLRLQDGLEISALKLKNAEGTGPTEGQIRLKP